MESSAHRPVWLLPKSVLEGDPETAAAIKRRRLVQEALDVVVGRQDSYNPQAVLQVFWLHSKSRPCLHDCHRRQLTW